MARRPRSSEPPDQPDQDEGSRFGSAIVSEAKDRLIQGDEWEGAFFRSYVDDTKFANGDSDNGWQWPDTVKQNRDLNNRPCLTINKTRTIVQKLANESKQNPPEPRIKPVGGEVSYEAAELWEGLLRHIFYLSNAQATFAAAKENQLEGGIGYWRVKHDFEDDESWNQEVLLEYLDPPAVRLDCNIRTVSGEDAMWAILFWDYNRKEFKKQFPGVSVPPANAIGSLDTWIRRDSIRVAEYYRIAITKDELVYLEDSQGNCWTGLRSTIPAAWNEYLQAYESGQIKGGMFKKRPVNHRQLQWFKIAGNEVVEQRDLKGKYIPIARMPGRERKIDGQLYRSGIVRALKDPQRMYNYNSSGEVEVVALQTKSPWIVAAAAIEGNETAWNNSNRQNPAYLTFRHRDDEGDEIPPPQRMDPPTPAQGFLEGLRIAAMEMEMASGVHQEQTDNPALERTPTAIDERVRKGEVINYDFTHNEMEAIRHTAVIILDLAPHIYDRKRLVKIRAKDGTISNINIDPGAEQVYQQQGSDEDKALNIVLNPKLGKYAVEADVGPAYQTQRQEAWHAFIQIVAQSPELMNIIGDLGFLAADFPMANEIAKRLRRHIEQTMPWLLEDSKVGPVIQKLTEELQKNQKQLADVLEKYSALRMTMKGKEELRDIEVQDAQNRRLTAEAGAVADLAAIDEVGGLKKLIAKTLGQMLGWSPEQIEQANSEVLESQQASGEAEAQ